jgi:hypothetical protein
MKNFSTWFKTRSNRIYLYGVGVATGPVLVYYGVADEKEVALWSGLLLTALGLTAARNTNEKE